MKIHPGVLLGVLVTSAGAAPLRGEESPPVPLSIAADDVPVCGSMVEVDVREGATRAEVEGELLAVSNDKVWVLASRGGGQGDVLEYSQAELERLTVLTRPVASRQIAAWTALGFFSSVSHGGWGMYTGALWLLAGGATAIWDHELRKEKVDVEGGEALEPLWSHARFPPGVDVSRIGPTAPLCAEGLSATTTRLDAFSPQLRSRSR